MNIKTIEKDNQTIVMLNGRIDSINAKDYEADFLELINNNKINIVLDCSNLNYISSAGLRAFLILQKKVNEMNGYLLIVNIIPSIKEIFDITGFTSIFNISNNSQ